MFVTTSENLLLAIASKMPKNLDISGINFEGLNHN